MNAVIHISPYKMIRNIFSSVIGALIMLLVALSLKEFNLSYIQQIISILLSITVYAFVVLAIIGAPWYWYLLMIPAMIISGLIYVSVYVVYVSLCFYIKRGDAVAKSMEGTINKAANYPPVIFNTIVKTLFFTLIPTFFYTFVPVQYVFLTPNLWWVLGAIAVTIVWVVLAFMLFKLGLKKYNSGNLMGGRL